MKLNNSKTWLLDVSFWGYPCCQWKPELGELDVKIGKVEPDDVIQFSWKNGLDYKKSAINDTMNWSTGNGNAVCVGYLVNMRFDNGEWNTPTELDISRYLRVRLLPMQLQTLVEQFTSQTHLVKPMSLLKSHHLIFGSRGFGLSLQFFQVFCCKTVEFSWICVCLGSVNVTSAPSYLIP